MRLNFFAILKNKTKKTQKANKVRIKLANPTFPMLTGVLSLFLSLLLTSCRTSACIFLSIRGPFPPSHPGAGQLLAVFSIVCHSIDVSVQ